jgi:hypothetical protein
MEQGISEGLNDSLFEHKAVSRTHIDITTTILKAQWNPRSSRSNPAFTRGIGLKVDLQHS